MPHWCYWAVLVLPSGFGAAGRSWCSRAALLLLEGVDATEGSAAALWVAEGA
ncbi:hypothetical protein IWW55_000560 [Coemansia sp. RSA 2706]|nr:hypothetical protein IWW55_000560 [Coemansia sp. RSA 2706]